MAQIGELQAGIVFDIEGATANLQEFANQTIESADIIEESVARMTEAFAGLDEEVMPGTEGVTEAVNTMSADVVDAVNSMSSDLEGRLAGIDESLSTMATTMDEVAVNTEESAVAMDGSFSMLSGGGMGQLILAYFALKAAVDATVGSFDTFQVDMFKLQDFAGVPASAIGSLQNKITSLSNATGTSADDISMAAYHIVSALGATEGTGAQGMEVLQLSAEGAAMGMGTASDVANVLTQEMLVFHVSASEAFNDLIVGTRDGNMNMSDFANNFSNVAMAASALGIPIKEAISDFDTLVSINHNASTTQAELSQAYSAFLKPNKDLAEVINYLGYSSGTAMIKALGFSGAIKDLADNGFLASDKIALLFGNVRALRDMIEMSHGGLATASKDMQDLNNDAGTGNKAWQDYTQTQQYSLSTVWSQVINTFREIGGVISGVVGSALQDVAPLWNLLVQEVKDNSKELQEWGLVIGVIFKYGIETVLTILIALIGGVVELASKMADFGNWLTSQDWGKDFRNMLGGIGNFFGGLINDAESWGKNLLNMFIQGMMNGIPGLKGVTTAVANGIKSLLGIHSPSEEGPLSDSDKWMPNLMNMFIHDIQQQTPMLKQAVNSAISGVGGSNGAFGTSVFQNTTPAPMVPGGILSTSNVINLTQQVVNNGVNDSWATTRATQNGMNNYDLSRLLYMM